MDLEIREILPHEYDPLDKLMVSVYSNLQVFPSPAEQPKYYDMLRNIGKLNEKDGISVLVAVSQKGEIMGGVVYSDLDLMQEKLQVYGFRLGLT